MSRKKIAAANWKMNTTVQEGTSLLKALVGNPLDAHTTVVINAPATHLYTLAQIETPDNVHIGAQNVYPKENGAYTGETSPSMITATGASYVVIGHSERRQYFEESNQFLAEKLRICLEHKLIPIFCCGEGLDIRKAGNHVDHVIGQLKESFATFTSAELDTVVIAYEPIWAIGTGETASPDQAQEMHAAIRAYLRLDFGNELADKMPILYGGSVKPGNAKEIFGKADVDGGLVGGASLKADMFAEIVNAF